MIEIFKTNVRHVENALLVINEIKQYLPDAIINFDLEDCDKILRIEGEIIFIDKIISIVKSKGYQCELLI